MMKLTVDHPDVQTVYLQVYKNFIESVDAIDNGITQYDTDAPARSAVQQHVLMHHTAGLGSSNYTASLATSSSLAVNLLLFVLLLSRCITTLNGPICSPASGTVSVCKPGMSIIQPWQRALRASILPGISPTQMKCWMLASPRPCSLQVIQGTTQNTHSLAGLEPLLA